MKKFKAKQGNSKVYPIDKDTFDKVTKKSRPYYYAEDQKCYAICPQCDNPIQLIGLYKQTKVAPYGKHYAKNIPLASYNQQAYDFCPYHVDSFKLNRNIRKRKTTDFERNIYYTVRDNFDSAVYILSRELNIKVTQKMAEEILRAYVAHEAWLYPGSSLNNIPWMLGYFLPARSLFKQLIKKDSDLYRAIVSNCSKVEFEDSEYYSEYSILTNNGWPGIMSTMILHNRKLDEQELVQETIVHNVFLDDESHTSIYTNELKINESYFLNLINSDKRYRNDRLLKLAKEYMPELE